MNPVSTFAAGTGEEAPSPLAVLESTFCALTSGPRPLALPARLVAVGNPSAQGVVSLDVVRAVLRRAGATSEVAARVWPDVVRRARAPKAEAWVIGAAGMAAPSLHQVIRRRSWQGLAERHDVEQEALAAFLTALRTIAPVGPDVFHRIRQAVDAALDRMHNRAENDQDTLVPLEDSLADNAMQMPSGGPEVVLARAVARGVISASEAELIAAKRLEGQPATACANTPATVRKLQRTRRAAEARLVDALRRGEL